jgi:hypothetical protein
VRAPDAAGEAYWANQVLSGAVTVGAAVYDIANGATGNDAINLTFKIAAADYFTSETSASLNGLTAPLTADFLDEAHASVVPAHASATQTPFLNESEVATSSWIIQHSVQSGLTIVGFETGHSVLIGSTGNDTITAALSPTAPDTIATDGGADAITLVLGLMGAPNHIELYAGAGVLTNNGPGGDDSAIISATPNSIVDAQDNAQPGWWGVTPAGLNGNGNNDNFVSDRVSQLTPANLSLSPPFTFFFSSAYGTSIDASTVTGFGSTGVVDISVGAFSGLLSNFDSAGSANSDPVAVAHSTATTAQFTQAIFTDPGVFSIEQSASVNYATGTDHANVLLLGAKFANAEAVAQTLWSFGSPESSSVGFDNGVTLKYIGPSPHGLDYVGHFLVAYANLSGDAVLADLDIASIAQTIYGTGADPSAALSVSDLVTLVGVPIASLHTANIHFVA